MCVGTLEQAASVPVVYATAYYSLVVRGRLRRGETVLIHSGSGGVGQAAIAIALSMNCKVFTTVGKYLTTHRRTSSDITHCCLFLYESLFLPLKERPPKVFNAFFIISITCYSYHTISLFQ